MMIFLAIILFLLVSFDMKTKYDKYWETMKKINLLLYVAFVLNPRSKMKALVFWLRRCNDIE
jgi:predicted membrane chloride channel (bestrophin family)